MVYNNKKLFLQFPEKIKIFKLPTTKIVKKI